MTVADADVLFAEHRQGVFRYLSRLVGHPETARDLTQEVFLRVSRSRVPEDGAAGRRAWIFTIARNLALNHVRDATRRSAVISPRSADGPLRPDTPPLESATPAVQELAVAIREALDALPAVDRDVFLLRETAGLSYAEIATTVGLTIEAVRTRLRDARARLRTALDGPIAVRRRQPIRYDGGEES